MRNAFSAMAVHSDRALWTTSPPSTAKGAWRSRFSTMGGAGGGAKSALAGYEKAAKIPCRVIMENSNVVSP